MPRLRAANKRISPGGGPLVGGTVATRRQVPRLELVRVSDGSYAAMDRRKEVGRLSYVALVGRQGSCAEPGSGAGGAGASVWG
jgi:hypothetical protein